MAASTRPPRIASASVSPDFLRRRTGWGVQHHCACLKLRATAWPKALCHLEQSHGVVAKRIHFGRRDADLDAWRKQFVEHIPRCHAECRRREHADGVAGQYRHHSGSAILDQLARVPGVSRCEDIDMFALLDALAHPGGRTELRRDRQAMRLAERRGDLRHRLAQASRSVKDKVLRPCLCHRREQHQNGRCELGYGAYPFFKGRPYGRPVAARVSNMISSMRRPGVKAANPGGRATPSGMRGQVSTSAITVRTGIFAA